MLCPVEWLGADAFGYGLNENTDEAVTLRLSGNTVAARGDRGHVTPAAGKLHVFHP